VVTKRFRLGESGIVTKNTGVVSVRRGSRGIREFHMDRLGVGRKKEGGEGNRRGEKGEEILTGSEKHKCDYTSREKRLPTGTGETVGRAPSWEKGGVFCKGSPVKNFAVWGGGQDIFPEGKGGSRLPERDKWATTVKKNLLVVASVLRQTVPGFL